jgi:EAL domain-containing protein (putative c-di-GMP-specific phosphodiesterase class I)/GGDEF domain-containing protein
VTTDARAAARCQDGSSCVRNDSSEILDRGAVWPRFQGCRQMAAHSGQKVSWLMSALRLQRTEPDAQAFPTSHQTGLFAYRLGDGSGPISRLLTERALSSVFQPIVSLTGGGIHAHEALIRGPQGMPLQSPDALFAAARREGLLQDLEVACVLAALERWAALKQNGRLFVNISASALARCFHGRSGVHITEYVSRFGLNPGMVVFELTEHEQVTDIVQLVEIAREVHAAGMSFALDDFGDGRSSLRLWSELSPDVVKIDKYFTGQISQHAKKLKTLRALMQIAETFGTTLVAEGVETGDDLRVLRDLGVPLVQGYFLGRPDRQPRERIDAAAQSVLDDSRVAVMPLQRMVSSPGRLSQGQVLVAAPLTPQATNDEAAAIFHEHPDWHALAVVENGVAVALLGRQQFLDRYAKLYFKEIYGRRPCMTFANVSPTLIDVADDIDHLIRVLTSQDQRYLSEGFVYTVNGRYHGLGTGHQLVRQVTESRIEAARHANPLTLLPGNIPISEHIDRLLGSGADFVVSYADLSGFKPFNDYYGYWRGDEVIKLVAATVTAHCDPKRDFVGHVGGDDFVVLFQSSDWERRCEEMVAEFNTKSIGLYDEDARAAGGIEAEDRGGVKRFFGFTLLYMGVIPVRGRSSYENASGVASAAARAKQMAKSSARSIYIDR